MKSGFIACYMESLQLDCKRDLILKKLIKIRSRLQSSCKDSTEQAMRPTAIFHVRRMANEKWIKRSVFL